MKKRLLVILILMAVCALCGAGAVLAEANPGVDFGELVAACEPQPYGGLSLQETEPFEPIAIDPETFTERIGGLNSVDAAAAFFCEIGLPLDIGNCEFVFQYQDHLSSARWDSTMQNAPLEVATVACTVPRNDDANDNLVFVFIKENGCDTLTDVLNAFGDVQIVSDSGHETIWLAGETGGTYNTVRWYNVPQRKTALTFLAEGVTADRTDYHVKVKAAADLIVNGTLPENGMLAVRKQVSVFDLTQAMVSQDAPEILLYTQVDVYACRPGGTFTPIRSKKFEGEDLPSVAGITCDQLVADADE